MNRPLIAMFACCAAIALASSAAARTVTVDSLAGTNATVTVGPGEATEYLGLAYGNTDGYANPGVGWDSIASLAVVPAAGGTYAVTLPFDPLTNATYRYSRFVLSEQPFDTRLDYLPGNGKTYFDTGITNASTDSVELAIRVSSYGSTSYSGIFGARAGASEKNLSSFCSNASEVYADFNSSNANTYRVAPQFAIASASTVLDMTIAISAAERHVAAFCDGAAVSSNRASTNKTDCADAFVCPGPAYILKVNGQPASGWATAGSGYGFVSCRIDRGGETIADMVPVSLFVDGVRVGRIYDLVRGKFLDRGGELAEFDITGVSGVKPRVTASAAQGYESSSFSAITVTGIDGGYISVTVRAVVAADLRLVLAYGASDAGNAIVDWDGVIAVAALEQGETKLKVPLPDGWGTSVNAFRLFAVSDYEAWIDSSGTQYIDTDLVNGNSNIVELSFQPLALPSNARAFYGCRNAAGSRNILMFVDGTCFYCDFNNGNYDTYRLKNVPRSTAHRYRMVNSAARRVAERLQDGAVVDTYSNTKACADVFTCAGNAYLFAANDMSGGSPAVLWSSNGLPSIRFYSLDVTTTDGAACCSIRPCKRGGVGEVYDSVRNRYFQNIGTGSFAFGCKGASLAVSDLITPQTQFHKGFMVIIH